VQGFELIAEASARSQRGHLDTVQVYERTNDPRTPISTVQGDTGPIIDLDGDLRGGLVDAELQFSLVDDVADTIFNAVSGAVDDAFRVALLRDGSEVWRGQLMPDDIQRPTRENGRYVLEMRAKTQYSILKSRTSALTGRHTLGAVIEDSLQDLAGTPVAAATAWYPFRDPPLTAEPLWAVERDVEALVGRDDEPLSLNDIAEDTARLLAARVMQWAGEWRVYQPKALSADTRWTTTEGSRQEDHELLYGAVETEVGGAERRRPAARQQSVRYNHGAIGGPLLENREFRDPIQAVSGDADFNWRPTSNTVFTQSTGIEGSLTLTGELLEFAPTGAPTRYVEQDGGFITGGPDATLKFGIVRTIFSGANDLAAADQYTYYRLQVGSYYWDNAAGAWTTTAEDNQQVFNNVIQQDVSTGLIDTAPLVDGSTPISGQLKLRLYSIFSLVDDASAADPWVITYDTVDIVRDVIGSDGDETLARLVTAGLEDVFAGKVLDEAQLLSGDGPTSLHRARLTIDGDSTDSWKVGTYGASEVASGTSLSELWAQESLQMSRPAPRLFTERWHLPASTPLTPFYVVPRGGTVTHWERLRLDFRRHMIDALWVQLQPVDSAAPVAFSEEGLRARTGVVEQRRAGIVAFSSIETLPIDIHAFVRGPTIGAGQVLWQYTTSQALQTRSPAISGSAPTGTQFDVEVRLPGGSFSKIGTATESGGTLSSDIGAGVLIVSGATVRYVGPDTEVTGNIDVSLQAVAA
jgi:hypothetical protein